MEFPAPISAQLPCCMFDTNLRMFWFCRAQRVTYESGVVHIISQWYVQHIKDDQWAIYNDMTSQKLSVDEASQLKNWEQLYHPRCVVKYSEMAYEMTTRALREWISQLFYIRIVSEVCQHDFPFLKPDEPAIANQTKLLTKMVYVPFVKFTYIERSPYTMTKEAIVQTVKKWTQAFDYIVGLVYTVQNSHPAVGTDRKAFGLTFSNSISEQLFAYKSALMKAITLPPSLPSNMTSTSNNSPIGSNTSSNTSSPVSLPPPAIVVSKKRAPPINEDGDINISPPSKKITNKSATN